MIEKILNRVYNSKDYQDLVRKRADFNFVGIRSEIKFSFSEDNKNLTITLIPDPDDVIIFQQSIKRTIEGVTNGV